MIASEGLDGLAVGIDVVLVEDVRRSLAQEGERYLRRLFTDHERDCCEGPPEVAAQGLAARFAAKEAVIKVLRPDGHQPDWRSVEIRRREDGSCTVVLDGSAARLAAERGLGEIAVSLCHEGPLAVSMAAAQRRPVEATASGAGGRREVAP